MNNPEIKAPAERLIERIKALISLADRQIKAECRKVIRGSSNSAIDFSGDEIMTLRVLRSLGGNVPLKRVVERMTEIKEEPVHSSTISAMMTRFESQGLLARADNPNDKRQPLNTLSAEGEELARRLDEADQVVLKNIMDSLRLDDALVVALGQRVELAYERIQQLLQAKPTIAGVYDYALGGFSYADFDRRWVDDKLKDQPRLLDAAKANRAFLQRAVHWLAAKQHITQFLDIGSGFPTNRNTHEVAFEFSPQICTTYVDSDPDVVWRSSNLLHETPNVEVAQQDLRLIKRWLASERFHNLDLTKPIGVLLVAVLHFLTEDSEVRDILGFLRKKLVPGSYLVISHSVAKGKHKEFIQSLLKDYNRQVTNAGLRTPETIADLLSGFEIVAPPGLVPISEWMPELPDMLRGTRIPPDYSPLVACVAKR